MKKRFRGNKAYDYAKESFDVKQVRLHLNGDRVKLAGARAEYSSLDDLLRVNLDDKCGPSFNEILCF